jgi:hypothetical protein
MVFQIIKGFVYPVWLEVVVDYRYYTASIDDLGIGGGKFTVNRVLVVTEYEGHPTGLMGVQSHLHVV